MTLDQKTAVERLRSQGLGYRKIAIETGVSENTVKSYLRRCPAALPTSTMEEAVKADEVVEVDEERDTKPCHFCGQPVPQNPGRKEKKFCSVECRKRAAELAAEYDRLDAEVKAVETEIQKRQSCGRRIETLVAALETAGEDFTVSLWGSMVEKVTVFGDGLVFTLTSGEDVRVAPC